MMKKIQLISHSNRNNNINKRLKVKEVEMKIRQSKRDNQQKYNIQLLFLHRTASRNKKIVNIILILLPLNLPKEKRLNQSTKSKYRITKSLE